MSTSPALWTPLVSLLHGDRIRRPQSAGSTSGQEQPSKPIVTTDSRYPARKEAAGTEGGGSLHNIGAAVYCQVFTLCLRFLKSEERGLGEQMNGNTNVLNVGWEGEEKEEIEPIPISGSELDVTPAMTHSRGRSCFGGGVEEWVHRGRRPYGPWGTNKARVTKGASALQLSPPSVVQSLSPPRSLSLSPEPAKECAFCKPTHTHTRGVSSPSVVSYYCNGWCKECCATENARMQRKHNRHVETFCRLGPAAQHSSLCWQDNGEQHSHKPSDTPPPPWCQILLSWFLHQSPRHFPDIKRSCSLGVSARGPRFITNFREKKLFKPNPGKQCEAGAEQGGAINLAWRIKPFPWHCSGWPLSCSCWGGRWAGWGGARLCCLNLPTCWRPAHFTHGHPKAADREVQVTHTCRRRNSLHNKRRDIKSGRWKAL